MWAGRSGWERLLVAGLETLGLETLGLETGWLEWWVRRPLTRREWMRGRRNRCRRGPGR